MIEFGVRHFFDQIDVVGATVLWLLVALSLASWTFTIGWGLLSVPGAIQRRRFAALVLGADADVAEVSPPVPRGARVEAALLGETQSCLRLARAGERFAAGGGLAAHLTRALRQCLDRATVAEERGLALLATTAATAPYLGLLGTVWGIYHALVRIGSTGEAGLAAVAGPVGEALIMTGLGLAVAIPAVFAHNVLQRSHRLRQAALEDFATTLLRRATAPSPARCAGADTLVSLSPTQRGCH